MKRNLQCLTASAIMTLFLSLIVRNDTIFLIRAFMNLRLTRQIAILIQLPSPKGTNEGKLPGKPFSLLNICSQLCLHESGELKSNRTD